MNLNSFVLNSAGILVRSTYQVTPEYVRRSDDLPADVVIGMMFGDEGKGKIVDSLPGHGIRFNGGHNAGHTLIILINGKWVEFDLHIVPSSIVDPSKIAIIARTCVVGIDLPKLRKRNEKDTSDTYEMWNKGDYTSIICPHSLDTLQGRREDGSLIRVGVMPELEQVQNKGVDPNGRLFISRYASMIGVHHVLMDALSEEIRNRLEVRKLGSTGSGIAPAYGKTFDILDHALQYTTKIKNDEYQTLARELEKLNEERKDITIEYALRNPNGYTAFVEREWNLIKKYFPKVSFDEIKKENNKQIALLRGRIDTGAIYLCDERELIKSRIEKGEKFVGEGAQAALISESHSIWGTKSNANIEAFCEATGIMPAQIANVFTVMKLPPSSVGTRPIDFMKYIETDVLKALRQKYQEFGVSTGRPRDIVKISLVEIARAVELIMKGMDQKMRDRIVPVLNRVDGLQDFAKLTDGNIPFVTGYTHSVGGTPIHIGLRSSGLGGSREIPITPSNLLANYPTREQINHPDMFGIQRASVLEGTLSGDMSVTNEKLGDTIRYTIEYILAAMFEGNGPREVIVGTGKRREDLALVKGLGPSRSFL